MIRVAIVGTGGISDTHIQAFQQFGERCQITCLVDTDEPRARQKAERYELNARIYTSWQAMVEQETIDLAAICLPPYIHAAATIDLLDAGINVLLEKPMASSLEECDSMLAAVDRSGSLLSVVAQNRYKTPMMRAKQIIESGIIGKVLHTQVDSYWWRGNLYYDLWWRGTWEKEGGGCTLNHAVHQLDQFLWVGGMPQQVQAVVANLNHDNSEVEDFSTAVLRYDDGRIGQLTASLVHHGEIQRLLVQGEYASIEVPWQVWASKQRDNGFPDPDPAKIAEIETYYRNLPEVPYDGHAGQIDNVLGALEGEQELFIDGQQGRNTIELVTAIYQSGFSAQPVTLPLSPDSPFYTRTGILANAPHFHEKTHSVDGFADDAITLGSDYGS